MRQNSMQTPLRQQEQSVPKTDNNNFTNAKAPVSFGKLNEKTEFTPGGPPSLIIQNNDPRPTINQNQTVKDVLQRLHNRLADTQDTQDESTTNNDRLLSDTTASESKKKSRKKKPLMTI